VVPAGYLERGESTEDGARREAAEEAGARIELTGLLALYNVVRIGQVQLFYAARLLDPHVVAGPESLELDLFDWRAIPWDELAFPSVHWVLRRALKLKDQDGPHLPALGP
jgi:8-oxo-dGTP pyrophosphatase MutT (NUDIX family)